MGGKLAKYSLLKMTQLILSAMDSDEINSIGDTTEAQQVVDIIETVHDHLAATMQIPEHYDQFELDSYGSNSKPTLMLVPTLVEQIIWAKYDYRGNSETVRNMVPLTQLSNNEFTQRMNSMDTADSTVVDFTWQNQLGETITFLVRNNAWPRYYCSPDDHTLVFDSYMAAEESRLTGSRTLCYGKVVQQFQRSDSFVANFDDQQFQLFYNEAKSQCFAELKQVANAAADRRARQAKVHAVVVKNRTQDKSTRPSTPALIGRRHV